MPALDIRGLGVRYATKTGVVEALADQHAQLAGLLSNLAEPGWHAATRCAGWDVADVVLHLAQTDDMATGSATGRFAEVTATLEAVRGAAKEIS